MDSLSRLRKTRYIAVRKNKTYPRVTIKILTTSLISTSISRIVLTHLIKSVIQDPTTTTDPSISQATPPFLLNAHVVNMCTHSDDGCMYVLCMQNILYMEKMMRSRASVRYSTKGLYTHIALDIPLNFTHRYRLRSLSLSRPMALSMQECKRIASVEV